MISVDIKAKSFGQARVLQNVCFSLRRGECVAILGKSGIGKSTLLRLMAGIDEDFSGTVSRPDAMAFVFQEPTLLPWRTAADNLIIVHPALSGAGAREMLAKVGLADKADQFPGQMSLGQQRRLSLARAFAGNPELLLMDEPFVSLDKTTASDMLALTKALISETSPATLFVTHDEREADQLADRTLLLTGSPATVASNTNFAGYQREEAS
jgi:sulfonate transport system ATP-binding protein